MRSLIILFIFALAGGSAMADEQPLNRNDMRREMARLHEELLRLKKQIEQLSGNSGIARPMPDFKTLQDAPATELTQPVKQALMDLTRSINRLQKRSAPPPPAQMQHLSAKIGTQILTVPEGIHNRSFTLANLGTETVHNPRIIVNNQCNWYSTPDILNEILQPGMNNRDKALAIWQFLVQNRYHGYPAHHDIEIHDPVRFLNVYGYGFCDDAATNFMVLSEQAGVRARVWGLTGHVVPEAFFENGWHMLDPDGEIYYLDDDGHTISSIQTLEQRPDIIRKYPSPIYTDAQKLIDIYTTTHDNKITEWYREKSEATHTLSFSLRPGESLTRNRDNRGHYFSSEYLSEPNRYGNGLFVFEPLFENDLYQKGAESVQNLQVHTVGKIPSLSSSNGNLTYRFASPYPYLDSQVALSGNGHITLSFSETGEAWTEIQSADLRGDLTIPFGGYLQNGHGRPTYSYYLKLTLDGDIQNLRYESTIQVAPQSLPVLKPGNNTVQYIDDSQNNQPVRISFGYDLENPK